MLEEFDKTKVNEYRIKELLELCIKDQPQMDPYWLWLCCVDFHIKDELKMDPPKKEELKIIFEEESKKILYENIKIEI